MAAQPRFTCSATQSGEHAVVSMSGELDLSTAPQLRGTVVDLIDTGVRHVVFDLSGVSFLDSTALGMLLRSFERIRTVGGRMAVVLGDPSVRRVFKLTQLDEVLPLYDSLAQAEAALLAAV